MSTKRKNIEDPASCWNKAADDEIVFILRGTDPAAPATITAWCAERERLGLNSFNDGKLQSARGIAREIAESVSRKMVVLHLTEKELSVIHDALLPELHRGNERSKIAANALEELRKVIKKD